MTLVRHSALVAWAVLRSIGIPSVGLAVVVAVLEATGAMVLGGVVWTFPLIFLFLGIVHEVGHVVCMHAVGNPLEVVRFAGSRQVELVYGSGGRARDVACVVAGPAAPAVLAVGAILLRQDALPVLALDVMGIGHLLTLAVPIGDGAQLRLLLRRASPVSVGHPGT